ncbi:hypothetical protein OAV88_01835 [bacterium]|nr:hypothetical protein [bacterium]
MDNISCFLSLSLSLSLSHTHTYNTRSTHLTHIPITDTNAVRAVQRLQA